MLTLHTLFFLKGLLLAEAEAGIDIWIRADMVNGQKESRYLRKSFQGTGKDYALLEIVR